MFTGLVEELGKVVSVADDGSGGRRLTIGAELAESCDLGDSVAINGCCLTVVDWCVTDFTFQAGPETLAKTNLGQLVAGDRVNLERALRVGDRLGGHMVTGHVDGVGQLAERQTTGEWQTVWFTGPPELMRLLVPKGSVTVDGVSLTVCEVRPDRFSVMLIPHTLQVTTLGFRPLGGAVNLETDIIGKYVAQCLTPYR